MSRSPIKSLRGVAALVALLLVFLLVRNYWGDYRRAKGSGSGGKEATASIEPTATDGAGGDESGSEDETGNQASDEQQASPSGTVVVLTDGVNFRKGPSTDAELIDGLRKGQRLDYLGREDSWYRVRASDGTEGYVSANEMYTRLEQ